MAKKKTRRPIRSLQARLKNRRVTGYLMPDGTIGYVTKRLDGRDIVMHRIRLSVEAVEVMYAIAIQMQIDHPEVFPPPQEKP